MIFTGRDHGNTDILECQWCDTKITVPRESIDINKAKCPRKTCGRSGYRESDGR